MPPRLTPARPPASSQNNASNLAGPPFYYAGAAPAGGNLATNTSVSVSKRGLDENGLYDLLNTPAVQDAIAAGLQDAGGCAVAACCA